MGKSGTVHRHHREGRRYSLDVNANSTYDAAHLYLTHVFGNPVWETESHERRGWRVNPKRSGESGPPRGVTLYARTDPPVEHWK
jgi:hypothetical protein